MSAIIEPNQQITEVVVVAKLTNFEDGTTGLGVYNSSGMDWISMLGLFRAGQLFMELSQFAYTEEED